MLVAAVAAAAVWSFSAGIERSLGLDCVLERLDEQGAPEGAPTGSGADVAAVTVASRSEARRMAPGMSARVLPLAIGLDAPEVLDAEVVAVTKSPVELPNWAGTGVPATGHVVRLRLLSAPAGSFADGDACTVRVVLERRAPISWLVPSAPG